MIDARSLAMLPLSLSSWLLDGSSGRSYFICGWECGLSGEEWGQYGRAGNGCKHKRHLEVLVETWPWRSVF